MFDILSESERKYSHHRCILLPGKSYTYQELAKQVRAVQKRLHFLGFKKGDSLFIQHENDVRLIFLFFAAFYQGLKLYLINTRLKDFFLEKQLGKISIYRTLEQLSDGKKAAAIDQDFNFHRPFVHLFTSGSSASPKLARLSYANFFYSALGADLMEQKDVWGITLPFYHVGGLMTFMRAFLKGAAISFIKEKATHLSLVPTQLLRMVERKEKMPYRYLLVGGDKMPYPLYKRVEHLPLYLTYGLTEMASSVLIQKNPKFFEGLPYLGFPLKHRLIQLKNQEMIVTGKTLFLGYEGEEKPKKFFTGDLADYHPQYGYRIIGRKDRQFISGGENILPEEIEKKLLELPEICKAKVMPIPDPEYGMRPIAFIESLNTPIDEKKILSHLKTSLPSYKVPDKIYPFHAFERFYLKMPVG